MLKLVPTKTCATTLNGLPFTLEIILNFIVAFLFVLKSLISEIKGEKKEMYCWDSNQRPLTYLPGFKLETSGLQEQCSNLYTTETSQLSFFKKCPL